MTLREYLEKQISYWMDAKNEFPQGHHLHQVYKGKADAYTDILQTCPGSVLDKKILDEVW
mgnify:CR=1 FL=1